MITRQHRFHGHNSLSFAYKGGQTVRHPQLSLRYVANSRRQEFRLAVVVSKKVAKSAVLRNRIRRRIYEVVREQQPLLDSPYDLIVTVFDAGLAVVDAKTLHDLVVAQLRKAGVIGVTNPSQRGILDLPKAPTTPDPPTAPGSHFSLVNEPTGSPPPDKLSSGSPVDESGDGVISGKSSIVKTKGKG